MYDLERLMDTEHAEAALQDKTLYDKIIEHRQHFTPVRGLSYENHQPTLIQFVPPEAVREVWKEDYHRVESTIYGEPLDFTTLLLRLQELQVRSRLMGAQHGLLGLKATALRNYPEDELPRGEDVSISYNVQFVKDPYRPEGPANITITYRLTLVQFKSRWFCTSIEIHRPRPGTRTQLS